MKDKARILVVDDEEGIRFTFEIFLSDEGHDVTTVSNYDEAMDIISKEKFDLVFADIILGGKTGLDLVQELRKRHTDCPVVIITGDPTIKSFSAALKLKAFEYLAKPVGKEKLLLITRKILNGGEGGI